MKMNRDFSFTKSKLFFLLALLLILSSGPLFSQQQEEYEQIGSEACVECHETSVHETRFNEDLSHSIHEGFGCLECHTDKGTLPHKENLEFYVGFNGCITCHEDAGEEYTVHGRSTQAEDEEIPSCADCHGDHAVLPSSAKLASTHPTNLPLTCGVCHKDLDLIARREIDQGHPVNVYESSVHGVSIQSGVEGAATCNDCHSRQGTAHKIFSADNPESSVYHFNIPKTCGACHAEVEAEYWKGIHGELVSRGDAESPVCTHCHGEHGIISPRDPRSPVSAAHLAEDTCTPCHDSISLTEKYGISTGRRPTFIDSYHGLKTQSGDLFVANCASCHGVHLILPSLDPESSIHPENLQVTCGECHPGMSAELASVPIHETRAPDERNQTADLIKFIYIIAIIVIIGLMALHWLIDLLRQIVLVMKKPQVRRMRTDEVWQHMVLMVSFTVLVITGFALRYGDSWLASFIFGWDHGFMVRGIVHRVAAAGLIFGSLWHLFFLVTARGRRFLFDMLPNFLDFLQFMQRILYNLGLSKKTPRFKRFSYVEKAEYWALVWGTVVMIVTGLFLWFDNFFVTLLPEGFLEISLVFHFYEAILATLAILVWHLYSTVFSPHVYPMNPSWITGKMPRDMFIHEHADAEIEEVK